MAKLRATTNRKGQKYSREDNLKDKRLTGKARLTPKGNVRVDQDTIRYLGLRVGHNPNPSNFQRAVNIYRDALGRFTSGFTGTAKYKDEEVGTGRRNIRKRKVKEQREFYENKGRVKGFIEGYQKFNELQNEAAGFTDASNNPDYTLKRGQNIFLEDLYFGTENWVRDVQSNKDLIRMVQERLGLDMTVNYTSTRTMVEDYYRAQGMTAPSAPTDISKIQSSLLNPPAPPPAPTPTPPPAPTGNRISRGEDLFDYSNLIDYAEANVRTPAEKRTARENRFDVANLRENSEIRNFLDDITNPSVVRTVKKVDYQALDYIEKEVFSHFKVSTSSGYKYYPFKQERGVITTKTPYFASAKDAIDFDYNNFDEEYRNYMAENVAPYVDKEIIRLLTPHVDFTRIEGGETVRIQREVLFLEAGFSAERRGTTGSELEVKFRGRGEIDPATGKRKLTEAQKYILSNYLTYNPNQDKVVSKSRDAVDDDMIDWEEYERLLSLETNPNLKDTRTALSDPTIARELVDSSGNPLTGKALQDKLEAIQLREGREELQRKYTNYVQSDKTLRYQDNADVKVLGTGDDPTKSDQRTVVKGSIMRRVGSSALESDIIPPTATSLTSSFGAVNPTLDSGLMTPKGRTTASTVGKRAKTSNAIMTAMRKKGRLGSRIENGKVVRTVNDDDLVRMSRHIQDKRAKSMENKIRELNYMISSGNSKASARANKYGIDNATTSGWAAITDDATRLTQIRNYFEARKTANPDEFYGKLSLPSDSDIDSFNRYISEPDRASSIHYDPMGGRFYMGREEWANTTMLNDPNNFSQISLRELYKMEGEMASALNTAYQTGHGGGLEAHHWMQHIYIQGNTFEPVLVKDSRQPGSSSIPNPQIQLIADINDTTKSLKDRQAAAASLKKIYTGNTGMYALQLNELKNLTIEVDKSIDRSLLETGSDTTLTGDNKAVWEASAKSFVRDNTYWNVKDKNEQTYTNEVSQILHNDDFAWKHAGVDADGNNIYKIDFDNSRYFAVKFTTDSKGNVVVDMNTSTAVTEGVLSGLPELLVRDQIKNDYSDELPAGSSYTDAENREIRRDRMLAMAVSYYDLDPSSHRGSGIDAINHPGKSWANTENYRNQIEKIRTLAQQQMADLAGGASKVDSESTRLVDSIFNELKEVSYMAGVSYHEREEHNLFLPFKQVTEKMYNLNNVQEKIREKEKQIEVFAQLRDVYKNYSSYTSSRDQTILQDLTNQINNTSRNVGYDKDQIAASLFDDDPLSKNAENNAKTRIAVFENADYIESEIKKLKSRSLDYTSITADVDAYKNKERKESKAYVLKSVANNFKTIEDRQEAYINYQNFLINEGGAEIDSAVIKNIQLRWRMLEAKKTQLQSNLETFLKSPEAKAEPSNSDLLSNIATQDTDSSSPTYQEWSLTPDAKSSTKRFVELLRTNTRKDEKYDMMNDSLDPISGYSKLTERNTP